ncbi:hypothetical protein E4U42_006311 [Claviceps africana]|uniref:Uncharacterized protein n=1 Tax=Claviceps africana TaxID=83212 RepID=A0A8K0NJE0_9HYPO|nr:hypothetical protein E4U42_006311 [Claviceps africana]
MSPADLSPRDHGNMSPLPTKTAAEVFRMSDAQFREFSKMHKEAANPVANPIVDWHSLSLQDRFRIGWKLVTPPSPAPAMLEDPSAKSRPLDLDKLDLLLQDVADGKVSSRREWTCESDENRTAPYSPWHNFRKAEIAAYDHLVNHGGRPLYSIDLLMPISRNPRAHEKLLKPYIRPSRNICLIELDDTSHYHVIARQWRRWKRFRNWQLDNRGIVDTVEVETERFRAHVQTEKRFWSMYKKCPDERFVDDPVELNRPGGTWDLMQRKRNWQRKHQRESGCEGFSDYERALMARLARHGFTRPFRLAEDWKQQDQLTTWIEYLGFEYWCLDRYTATAARLGPDYYKAWEEQRKLGIFKDDETPDFICTRAGRLHVEDRLERTKDAYTGEEWEAWHLLESLKRTRISKEQYMDMRAEALGRGWAAQDGVERTNQHAKSISVFFRETKYYQDAKDDIECQMNLVKWVVEQVDEIEKEQKSPAAPLETQPEGNEGAQAEDVSRVHSTSDRQKSTVEEHSPQPSNEKMGVTDIGASSRKGTRWSKDVIVGEGSPKGPHGEHDAYPSSSVVQTQVSVQTQIPSTEAKADSEAETDQAGTKRKATPETDDTAEMKSKRQRLNPK